jgi:2-phospho-L-lactate guanylyltransferase
MQEIIVAFKGWSGAKSRLNSVLSAGRHSQLVLNMLTHVIEIAKQAETGRVILLCGSPQMEGFCRRAHIDLLCLSSDTGADLNTALNALDKPRAPRLILPADLPYIEANDIRQLFTHYDAVECPLVVPCHKMAGTNALLYGTQDHGAFSFGPHSLVAHMRNWSGRGGPALQVENPNIALDIDTGSDLALSPAPALVAANG